MLDLNTQEKIFQNILKDPENNKCIDCGKIQKFKGSNPQWASVNNGILLCLECSGVHRSFGVRVSFVRSITMDSWSQEQIESINLGGNKNFKDFMSQYDIHDDFPQEQKYKTAAAQFYRERLQSLVAGVDISQEQPSIDEGKTIIDYSNPNYNKEFKPITNTNYSNINEKPIHEDILEKSYEFSQKITNKTQEIYNKALQTELGQKTNELGKTAVKKTSIVLQHVGSKADELAGKVQEKYQTKETQEKIKNTVNSVQNKITAGFGFMKAASYNLYTQAKEQYNNSQQQKYDNQRNQQQNDQQQNNNQFKNDDPLYPKQEDAKFEHLQQD